MLKELGKANLRILKECGCDLHYVNGEGECAATLAAAEGCVDSLRYLLEEVKVKDKGGRLRGRLARLEAGDDA